jgi:hypothetical protein
MRLQGHHFEIIHRDGQQHFDADAVSRLLHSGDINEARESGSESEEEHLVTMKDIRNLERFFKLQLAQHEVIMASNIREVSVVSPVSTQTDSNPTQTINSELHTAAAVLLTLSNTTPPEANHEL